MQNLFLNNFVVYATLLLIFTQLVIIIWVLAFFLFFFFFVQIVEFDLKGIALDNSSSLTIIVKDFETIGQNKYVPSFPLPTHSYPSIKHNFQYRSTRGNGTDSCCLLCSLFSVNAK